MCTARTHSAAGGRNVVGAALVRGGIGLLFVYVSLVPHRFLPETGLANWESSLAILLRLLPFGGAIVFIGFMIAALSYRSFLSFPLLTSLSVLFVTALFGSIGSEVPSLGMSRDVYYLVTGAGIGFSTWAAFSSEFHARQILGLCLGIATLVALYGIYEFTLETSPLYSEIFTESNFRYARLVEGREVFGSRILSSVGHPVYLGTYLLLFVPIGLAFVRHSGGAQRSIVWFALGVVIVGLVLTFSRGAWAGGALASVLFLRRSSGRILWWVVVSLAVILVGVLSFDRVWQTLERRQTLAQLQTFSTDQRGVAYRQSANLLFEQPLLGVGTGHYRYMSQRHGDFNDTPDNMYLRVLAENGIVGIASLIVVFGTIGKHLIDGSRRFARRGDVRNSDLCYAVFAALCGFWLDMVTCDALYFPLTRMTFWIVAGAGLAMAREASELPRV